MKKYSSAYAAAKAYCDSQDHLTEEDAATSQLISTMLASDILKPVPHPKGWAPVQWYLEIPALRSEPKGWYVFVGGCAKNDFGWEWHMKGDAGHLLEGPYRTKKEAVNFVGRRCGLEKPPRMTKGCVGGGVYVFEHLEIEDEWRSYLTTYTVMSAEKASEWEWV